MHPKYKKKSQKQKLIAKERIEILFEKADKKYKEFPKLSNRYIQLARKIAMKFKIRLTREQKRKFCKHCYSYLRPSRNSKIRIRDNKVIIYCENCKKYTRIPLKQKKYKQT